MLEGYIDFFMDPSLVDCYLKLKEELNELIQKKVSQELKLLQQNTMQILTVLPNLAFINSTLR